MAKLFYSYSHSDEALRDELEKHLATLKRNGLLEPWHDRKILAGDKWDRSIREELENADLILLLVSADFLASSYCQDVEIHRALERDQEGTARVVPVILRHCDWQHSELGHLQAVPRDGKPITSFPDKDEGFVQVVRELRRLLAEVDKPRDQPPSSPDPDQSVQSSFPSMMGTLPRVAPKVSIRKTFTDLDRDTFLDKAFAEIARYFREALSSLEQENAGVQTRFQGDTTTRFSATVYVHGQERASCSIRREGLMGSNGITYSDGASQFLSNSFNELLSISNDDQELYLRGMLGGLMLGENKPRMTIQEAADHLWRMLIQGLQ